MHRNQVLGLAAAAAGALLLSACGSTRDEVALGSTYRLVDGRGHTAGTVTLNPLGDGVVYNRDGRVVGRVTAP
jgi:hypothetical protein